jgi:small-conductance mechanosensitive channel
MYLKHILLSFLLLASFSNASEEENTTKDPILEKLLVQKNAIEMDLVENNIWSKIYSNYHTYKELKKEEVFLNASIKRLSKNKKLNKSKLEKEQQSKEILTGKLQLLKEYENDPFKKFLTPPIIEDLPNVNNPFQILGALSHQEKLNSDHDEYDARYDSLANIVEKLEEKQLLLSHLKLQDSQNPSHASEYIDTKEEIKTFAPILDIFKTTKNVYTKKIDEIKLKLKSDIKKEVGKTMVVGGIILFFIFMLFFIKFLVRKYMSGNDRFYTINKALNLTFMLFTLFTLLFSYIENVSYLVTILGFASAGIAIAMKDWFMSLLGWFTIVIGGTIHVGDRVKFVRAGVEYVGDIVDISMLRMTMHEDITLTTTITNRRAGRIIFIPNNFIFTDMISNYSHAGLKTVWDGIDFVVTFDSDIHKASQIAKEITKKYSKGYTDITRKQLNKLRSQYSMKNTNVEPRVFTFIQPYGMTISAWYLTNSYATLTLRSTISAEIIVRIQAEPNITLAFPTQSIYVDKDVRKPNIDIDAVLPNAGLY